MARLQITYERLLRQRIAGEGVKSTADVVRWMGAVQAQDYAAGRWAIGLRSEATTDAGVEAAFAAGEVVRTHVMRPTWHFLAPEDVRWMQALTAPRVRAALGSQFRSFGLDAPLLKRCTNTIIKALRGGKELTRAELSAALAQAGIAAKGIPLADIVIHAELDAIICSGRRRGKQFTYALVDERAPQQKSVTEEEALALLTERFFTSHGPATVRDFAWWSGLTVADIKRGVEMVRSKLVREEIDGQNYWMSPSTPQARLPRTAIHLLPNYDEYLSGYADRSAIMENDQAQALDARYNPLFNHPIISNGRVAGTWKRIIGRDSLRVEVRTFRPMTETEMQSLKAAEKRMAKFFGMKLDLTGVENRE